MDITIENGTITVCYKGNTGKVKIEDVPYSINKKTATCLKTKIRFNGGMDRINQAVHKNDIPEIVTLGWRCENETVYHLFKYIAEKYPA